MREGEEVCVVDGKPGKCRGMEKGSCCVCARSQREGKKLSASPETNATLVVRSECSRK